MEHGLDAESANQGRNRHFTFKIKPPSQREEKSEIQTLFKN